MISKKFLTKQKETQRLRNELMVARVAVGRDRDFGKFMYTLLYLKWIASKDLLYSTWNSAQCYVPAWMGGGFAGEDGYIYMYGWGFPGGSDGKESACNVGDLGLIPGSGKSPGGGHVNPLQYSCLENPHRQRSLVGYRGPWGHKESDTTERLNSHICMAESLCCSPETTTVLLTGCTPIQNKKFKAWGKK